MYNFTYFHTYKLEIGNLKIKTLGLEYPLEWPFTAYGIFIYELNRRINNSSCFNIRISLVGYFE